MAKHKRTPWVVDEALATGRLLEYQRAVLGSAVETGFVVGIGKKWILLHTLESDTTLSGHQAIREDDISRARLAVRKFPERALALRGETPRPLRGIDLDRTRDLLRTGTEHSRILVINIEYSDDSVCYIGAARNFGSRRFGLEGVTRGGRWEPVESRNYWYHEVSRIDLGGDYLDALLTVLDDRDAKREGRRDKKG